jgi:pyruvate/2-oxoacid:ferredoxin oxidoreductase alpha subunit
MDRVFEHRLRGLRALLPDHPVLRGTNPDVYFQARSREPLLRGVSGESQESNGFIFPNRRKRPSLVRVWGAPDAEEVVVMMGPVQRLRTRR